jgi:hypothetical protein
MVAGVLVIISMGVLTYKGATAREALGRELKALVPTWAKRDSGNSQASRVPTCSPSSGARTVTSTAGIGDGFGCAEPQRRRRREQSVDFQIRHLRVRPASIHGHRCVLQDLGTQAVQSQRSGGF